MSTRNFIAILLLIGCIVLSPAASARKKAKVPDEKDMAAYLLVYFKDDTHSLHMALSADGYSFTDVNNGRPVVSGDTIAQQRGIRDPHIMRRPRRSLLPGHDRTCTSTPRRPVTVTLNGNATAKPTAGATTAQWY